MEAREGGRQTGKEGEGRGGKGLERRDGGKVRREMRNKDRVRNGKKGKRRK